uniref:NAD(+) diphosphatase n=1 Tax=Wollemia nobilis TaxID=56998 RepID=A0A0C9SAC4_9CONI
MNRVGMKNHAFAGNPLIGAASTSSPTDSGLACVGSLFENAGAHKILPFKQGKPLVLCSASSTGADAAPMWRLAWQSVDECRDLFRSAGLELGEEGLVYLGPREGVAHWALDFSETGQQSQSFPEGKYAYVELRTLMVATDWSDENAVAELSIAGHARAILEWHGLSQFCGKCGTKTLPVEAGRRRQCQNSSCNKRFYPRVDPVVIMLVIDRANDCALLSHQSRFVPRMWSCLAGFIEPGESLEEAVRRETWEEVGIEVGEVVYHSSQPWPVGPSSMPCQLMVGFFAYAKSFNICVDKKELEDARWHSRQAVKNALTFPEYKQAQRASAFKVHQICDGVEKSRSFSSDFNVETGDSASMFVPGPFAIAHHLISSWANEDVDVLAS